MIAFINFMAPVLYWKRLPAGFFLFLAWLSAKAWGNGGFSLSAVDLVLMILSFLVLAFEFFKSGDISLLSFGWDLAYSVCTLILFTIIFTVLVQQRGWQELNISDFFVAFALLADAWVSPFNSFRTALRNFSAQVGGAQS